MFLWPPLLNALLTISKAKTIETSENNKLHPGVKRTLNNWGSTLWGSALWGLLSRAADFGSGVVHSGGLLSCATDFGCGNAHACRLETI